MAKGLAERLSLQIGDTVFIIGQGYHERFAAGAYPLRGIMQFGSPELNNSMAFLPLPLASELFSMEGMVTGLVLDIRDPNAMPQIQEEIRKKLPEQYELMSWKQMMPDIDNHMKADGMGYYIMMGILYTIILFGTFGTIFMITNERKYEFSMLLAIGMKRRFLAMTLIGEMVLLMICGALAGMFISIPLVLYFEKHPLRLGGEMAKAFESYGFEAVWPAQFSWSILIDQTLIVLVIGLLVGLYPVYHVMKFKEAGKIRL
jgi:ABC-type lipoprotein release transport system permease subunit